MQNHTRALTSRSGSPTLRWLALLVLLTSCEGGGDNLILNPPYSERVKLAEVSASFRNTSEERAFAHAVRLKEPEVRFDYRVDVRNRAGEKLYVRLASFQLVDEKGIELGKDDGGVVCTLDTGEIEGLLSCQVWIPKRDAAKVKPDKFGLNHFAVPLGQSGQAAYRDWLLKGRPNEKTQVEAEIAQMAAAPPCTKR